MTNASIIGTIKELDILNKEGIISTSPDTP